MAPSEFGLVGKVIVALAFVSIGCQAPNQIDPEAGPEFAEAADALQLELNSKALAFDFASLDNLPHGVTGDERFVFAAEVLNGRVVVLNRFTGQEVGTIPAPGGAFLLPFAVRVAHTGRLVVLDAGGFPDPSMPAVPKLYDYDYSWNASTQTFSATLSRTVSFAGYPVVFTEDFEILPDGSYVMSDSVIGALWLVLPDGTITPGIFPASGAPEDAIPALGPCFAPLTSVGGIPFGGGFAPGVGSLAFRKGNLYFGSSCLGGVRKVPVADLFNTALPPNLRGANITVVSAKPAGVAVESIKGLTFNKWSTDDRLFATDPIKLRAIRININTGAREVLADDPQLFNFPVAAAFLPPVLGLQPVVVAADQEHRLAAFNPLIPNDLLQAPFPITKVYLFH